VFPHWFGNGIDDRIADELRGCLDHLGLRDTMVHVEFRYSAGRVRLIEINPRPAGGAIPQLVSQVASKGLVELHLAAHLGDARRSLADLSLTGYAGALFIVPDRAGTVVRLEPSLREIDGVVSFKPGKFPRIVEAGRSNEDRLGHIVIRTETRLGLESVMRHARRRIKPLYEDPEPEIASLAATGAQR
jgi:cysteine synthase A